MATRRRTKRPLPKTESKAAPEIEKDVIFSPQRRLSVSVGIAGEYGSPKVGLTLSENIKDDADPMKKADETFEVLADKLLEKYDALAERLDEEVDEETEDDQEEYNKEDSEDSEDEEWEDSEEEDEDEEDSEEEDEDEDDEEEDLTEDEIMKMKKAELLELIEEEQLDVDPKGLKLKELREAVCDAYFGDEEEDEDEDSEDSDEDEEWDDDDWDDEDSEEDDD